MSARLGLAGALLCLNSAFAVPLVAPANVFYAGAGGVDCFRIPAIVQTAAGVLVAFAEARHGSCGDGAVHEIAMRRSSDGGATWLPKDNVTFVVGSASMPLGNPAAVYDSVRDRIVLIYTHIPYLKTTGVIFSTDDGESWSEPTVVDFGAANGSLCGPGTATQSDSGRLLVPSHHGAYDFDLVTYSDDGGETWTTIEQTFPKMDEAAITQLPNGSLLLAMRHQDTPTLGRALTRSDDDGASFSEISYGGAAWLAPVCQGSLVSFDGATYYSSPTCRPSCSRANLTVFKSTDSAASWAAQLLVYAPPSAGYSCLVHGRLLKSQLANLSATREAEGGVLYEASESGSIAFSRFPVNFPKRRSF